jgi:hypothetical protein
MVNIRTARITRSKEEVNIKQPRRYEQQEQTGIRGLIERKKAQFREQRTADIETRKERLKVLTAERKQRAEQYKLRKEEKKEKQEIRKFKTARFREALQSIKKAQQKAQFGKHEINPAFNLGKETPKKKKKRGKTITIRL